MKEMHRCGSWSAELAIYEQSMRCVELSKDRTKEGRVMSRVSLEYEQLFEKREDMLKGVFPAIILLMCFSRSITNAVST